MGQQRDANFLAKNPSQRKPVPSGTGACQSHRRKLYGWSFSFLFSLSLSLSLSLSRN